VIVRVEPLGADIEVRSGESIMAAAQRCGYRWPTVCGGQGTCRTCFLEIVDGGEHLSPVEPYEQEGLDTLGPLAARGTTRLACQVRATGPATVRKRGVRKLCEVAG
jgi:ferredoxin, 2Fe-2S